MQNVGTIGHVAHGKSTLTRALSTVNTGRFLKELEANMTIKLGYANVKARAGGRIICDCPVCLQVFKCENAKCPKPECYAAFSSKQMTKPTCARVGCNSPMTLVRHFSFVDNPGARFAFFSRARLLTAVFSVSRKQAITS